LADVKGRECELQEAHDEGTGNKEGRKEANFPLLEFCRNFIQKFFTKLILLAIFPN
jgi:hypothetical protein